MEQIKEQTEKKQDNRAVKDRGDSLKKHKVQMKCEKKDGDFNSIQADRGDIRSKKALARTHKSIIDKSKTNSKAVENVVKLEEKHEEPECGNDKRDLLSNNVNQITVNNVQRKENIELDRRRRIREKYTIKYNYIKREENYKIRTLDTAEDKIEESAKTQLNINSKQKNEETPPQQLTKNGGKMDRELDAIKVARKKPHIETSVTKSDNAKTYKTVTFVEPKTNKTTSLQIDILREFDKPKLINGANTIKANSKIVKLDIEKKPLKREKPLHKTKRIRKFRKAISPDSRRVASPVTEVAKWAPNSLNYHTKPYYEAWVNTTLAAINKGLKIDKTYMKTQEFTKQQIQKLVTDSIMSIPGDLTNELFTGRIKIRHKAN